VPTVDVAIIGAGPSGSAAAILLARAGCTVAVIDKATFPRDKICGDGLTTGALRHLESLGLRPADVASWQPVDDVVVHSPAGRSVTFPLPRGHGQFAVVARRADLDMALVDLARAAGATVHEGHAFETVDMRDDDVVVQAHGLEPVTARFVIGADGMWSPLRKALGANVAGYLGEWHAFRQYFRSVTPSAARDLHVWFEDDLLPGYVWSFPLPDGRANVGFGIQRGSGIRTQDMKQLWPALLDRPNIRRVLGPDAVAEGPHRAWPIPARVDAMQLASGRALFVGDAAAATDPMTGEGIGQAILSGMLAARAILADDGRSPTATRDRDPAATRARYVHAMERQLMADHRMSMRLLRVLARRRGAEAAVRVAGANSWTRRNFARWLFEDYPRAVLVTPSRWTRGMFTSDGPYRTSPTSSSS
jgi:menaquinone-9 beta-reductase